jgi:hypothetical protein
LKNLVNLFSAAAIILFLAGAVAGAQPIDSISLLPGWNLVSLPLQQPANASIASVLSGIKGAYEVVWAYSNQAWKVYDPNDSAGSTLTTMQAGVGYWIKTAAKNKLYVSGSTPSSSIQLGSGWNLVGYDGALCEAPSTAFSGLPPGDLQTVWGYPSQDWQSYDPGGSPGNLDKLCPGAGYWVNVSKEATWTPPVADNALAITVDGSECSAATVSQWPDKPCVSVTICDPADPSDCRTVSDILLDTGDYGLRMFQQVLPQPLLAALSKNQVQVGSVPLYECTEYGDGSAVWGPVQTASVVLAGEPAVQVPIQVIGSSTSDIIHGSGHACSGAYSGPSDALYNGSLGLGFFVQDCGDTCANSAQNGQYFTCSAGACSPVAVPPDGQVQNPVALLPVDNNGVIVMLPGVPPGGSVSANGYLVLGIGTQANNSASGATAYPADSNPNDLNYGNFTTKFGGASLSGYLDTGSNALFFPSSQIPTGDGGEWFDPPSLLALSATNVGYPSGPSGGVQFQVGNYDSLTASSNNVFSDIAAPGPDGQFDWGLPFFLGRNVYIGIEGTTSTLGVAGPYWAY